MSINKNIFKIFTLISIINFSVFTLLAQQTQQTPTPVPSPEVINEPVDNEVLKIDTNLIQTGVTVLDKKGQFVEKLKQDDFELKVDGKSVKLSFFESIVGNKNIENNAKKGIKDNKSVVSTFSSGPGRVILFVVDDLHLNAEGHVRTKKLILNFIEKEVDQNDILAIVSTTGKIGFLQQFTNDKEVLREAVNKLNYNRNYSAADRMNPPMSEYEALLIDRLDPEVTNIFAQQIISEIPGYDLESAKMQVRSRASNILFQAKNITNNTLSVLEQAIRRSAQLAGRKTVFFLSDGFIIDPQNSNFASRLQRITDAASRSNAVVYSFDVKGLVADLPEGTSTSSIATGYRVQAGERFEMQDGMNAVAENTGGKFFHNTNDLQGSVSKAFVETSSYYLLAWEPDAEISPQEKLKKIEVVVKNRPELQVRLQNGYFSQNVAAVKTNVETKTPEAIVEEQLITAARKQGIQSDLPTSMVLNYLEMPNEGSTLSTSLQIKNKYLAFTNENDKTFAKVDFLGIIYNSEGKREAYFRDRMTITYNPQQTAKDENRDMLHNFQTKLKPGLYQIRVATRDVKSGLIGNAVQWIKIPDLSNKKLALSSLLLGEVFNNIRQDQVTKVSNSNQIAAGMSVDRKFSRNANLRYLIFIYNAVRDSKSDVIIRTKLYRNGESLLDTQQRALPAEGENGKSLFYAAEIPLSALSTGVYELELTAEDRLGNQSLSKKVKFEVQ